MLIGELVKKSGLTKDTIRYYEKIGILNSRVVQRNPYNGYKNYSEEALEVINLLALGKLHGCTLNEMKQLLEIHYQNALTCFSLHPFIHTKLEEINSKIKMLEEQKANLESVLNTLNTCLKTGRGNEILKTPTM